MGKLMNKYQLLDNNFTFEYVQNCEDVKKLGRIIEVLRSGELGHFPVLQEKAVQKLRGLDPENNHLSDEKLQPCVRGNVDLSDWESEMKEQEAIMLAISKASSQNLPKVRSQNPVQSGKKERKGSSASKLPPKGKLSTKEYYERWDEYDAATDILQVDLEEERRKEEEKQIKIQQQKLENDILNSQLTMEEIAKSCSQLPEPMRALLAETARQKGNEHFNVQEFSLALLAYNTSISYKLTCAASNNRAMTYIKMGDHAAALADCNYVLSVEPDNVKALFRRSVCHKAIEDWENALKDIEKVLVLDPNNKIAQSDFKAVRKKLNIVDNAPKFKLKIEDVSSPTDDIPLMFYGQSSSRFFYYPNNRLRMMGGYFPCKCNGASHYRNPLCRGCGEAMMQNFERSRVIRKNLDPWLNAGEVIKLCRAQKTHFIIHNTTRNDNTAKRRPVQRQPITMAQPGPAVGSPLRTEPSKKNSNVNLVESRTFEASQPVRPGNIVEKTQPPKLTSIASLSEAPIPTKVAPVEATSPRSQVPRAASVGKSSKGADYEKTTRSPESYKHGRAHNKRNFETMLKEDLNRKQLLADDAKKRGDALSQAGIYPLSLRYYTTSIKLFPQIDTLLARATDHTRMRNFAEAIADCTEVLLKEPNNVVAYLRRAMAYISMPPEFNATKLAISDFQHVLDLKPTDGAIQEDVAKLFELITERNQMPTPPIKLCGHRTNTPVRRVNPPGAADNAANCKGIITKREQAVSKTTAESDVVKGQPQKDLPQTAVTNGQAPNTPNANTPPWHPLITNITICKSDGAEKLIYKVNEPTNRSEKKSDSPVPEIKAGTFKKKPPQNSMVFTSSNAKAAGDGADEAEKTLAKDGNTLSGVQKKGSANSKAKSKKNGRAQSNESPVTSSFQFFSRWESQKKSDKSYKERASILRSVAPNQLISVVGEKLDGDMLNELIESLSVMSLEEPEAAAEYLKCLPNLPRFEPVKLFMGPEETQRTKSLIDALEERNIAVEEDVKNALL